MSLEWGGLGLHKIREMNKALLCKWLWAFGEGNDKLWKKVIRSKYGVEQGGWYSKPCRYSHRCSFWKGIMLQKPFFERHISYLVGNGRRIKFWDDRWCCRDPLRTKFPNLYTAVDTKDCFISDMLETGELGSSWNFKPKRRLRDVEIREMTELLSLVGNFSATEDEYSRQWDEGRCEFSAKAVRQKFEEERRIQNQLGDFGFPGDRVWNTELVPP